MTLTPPQQRLLMSLARHSIYSALTQSPPAFDAPDDPALDIPAGCFVSLHDHDTHRLRGCIGHLQSSDPLRLSLPAAATGALHDPRFTQNPITTPQLQNLDVEISILSPMTPAKNTLDFDPAIHGIYLAFGQLAGCFLPQVARETGWSKQQLLDRLCTEKLGMSPFIWQNPHARLFTFTTLILGPEPFFNVTAPPLSL